MAYNNNKGPQHSGDVQYEGDPTDTQIDFENDFVAIKTNGQQRFIVSGSAITASVPMTGQSFNTATTAINSTHISSSLNISGSKFYGDGSTLSGVAPASAMSSFIVSGTSGPSQTITDGNTLNIVGGTGINTVASDGDNLTVNLSNTSVTQNSYTYTSLTVDQQGRITAASNGTAPAISQLVGASNNRVLTSMAGSTVNCESNLTFDGTMLQVSGTISASAGISGSAFFGDGAGLTNVMQRANSAANNRITTTVDSTTIQGESNLTFDGSRLTVTGDINMSNMTGSAISGALSLLDLQNGKLQVGTEEVGAGVMVKIKGTDSDVPLLIKSPSHDTILAVTGSGKVAVGGVHLSGKFNVSGSNSDILISAKGATTNPAFTLRGNGDASISGSLTVSGSVRGKQLYMTTHKYDADGTNAVYVRFDANGADGPSPTDNNKMVAPYSGQLIKVLVRGTAAGGFTAVTMHRNTDGSQNIDTSAIETREANMSSANTTYTFNFSTTAEYGPGDIVGIKINPSSDPGIVVATAVWEFDQNN